MEYYTIIRENIKNKALKVKALNDQADAIYDAVRKEAVSHYTGRSYRPDYEEADRLYKEAEEINKEIKVLAENLKASFAFTASNVIKDVLSKYTGRKYGPKTKQKIYEEMKAAGVGFYFDRNYRMCVYGFTPEGYTDYSCKDIYITAVDDNGHIFELIDGDNKIKDITAVKLINHYKYVDDIAGRQHEIENKFEEYKKLWSAAYEAQKELNNILPEGHKQYNGINFFNQYEKL